MMEEDLVAVGAWRNARCVTVGFAADPFRRMRLLEQLKHKRNSEEGSLIHEGLYIGSIFIFILF